MNFFPVDGASLAAWIEKWQALPIFIKDLIGVLLLFSFSFFIFISIRSFLISVLRKIASSSYFKWDDLLFENRVFHALVAALPFLLIYNGANLLVSSGKLLEKISLVAIGLSVLIAVNRALIAFNKYYKNLEISKSKPITGFIQLGQIILAIIAFIGAVSVLVGKSPLVILSGFGAFTAVLLLVFRETIISVMAGFQIQFNDMVRVGDWIEMPTHGIDGEILDLALHVTKVQNWDKTIVSIPTYKLINDPVKNWRGMSESGGRRIKRSILIDQNSIHFASPDEIAHWVKIDYLKDYIQTKHDELSSYNDHRDLTSTANGRRLTNIGTFRAYVKAYVREHPHIHRNLTTLIRQLPPSSDKGLPIEVYVFTNTTEWLAYEEVQSDVFDHLLSVLPEFGLKSYQRSSGTVSEKK